MLSWHEDVHDVLRRHLVWMFQIAERVEGGWARCYMANGKVKDSAFQLDQQLFPLLELAEYVLETGDQKTFEQFKPQVEAIIQMLLARKAPHAALFPTDETPADDPIALPYHLSSHILFWTVLTKLKRLGMEWGTLQDDLKTAIEQQFGTELNGKKLYAYATDGAGHYHLYHDANDFPTVLAPVWGFCAVDDLIWRNTIDFAFSEANTEGVYQGRLGSVHTRAPWSLGDVQDLIVARLLRDEGREAVAYQYLRLAAQPDGALPEAYNAETGEVVSRHWFAWPNAAFACVMLDAFKP
jgi:meiotically up-regulated gene 157 (Mug157) protein